MRNNIFKFGLIAFFSMIIFACDSEDSDGQILQSIDTEEAALTAKVDNATEVISDTFVQVYESEESLQKGPIRPHLPECATVTVVLTDASKEVTIDFWFGRMCSAWWAYRKRENQYVLYRRYRCYEFGDYL